MSKNKKNVISSLSLLALFIVYTIFVKTIGVVPIGPKFSKVGFANINIAVFNKIGTHLIFEKITDVMLIIPVVIGSFYTGIGIKQLLKEKSLKKVDNHIIALGVFYILLALVYAFFEFVIINYRPILEEGELAASFPSSHTVLILCVCGSSILINKYFYKKFKITKLENKISVITAFLVVLFRFISGVHWFTDIIGGILISSALLKLFDSVLFYLKSNK